MNINIKTLVNFLNRSLQEVHSKYIQRDLFALRNLLMKSKWLKHFLMSC